MPKTILINPINSPKKFFFYLIFMVVIINIITAYFSTGYYQADEQLHILEFTNYKLGLNSIGNMPSEFFTKMRSWLLPGFYFISYKIIHTFFPTINPFTTATIFRIESSLFATFSEILFIYTYYVATVKNFISQEDFPKRMLKWKIVSSVITLFWLIPYLSARTSAENFSNSFILLIYSCFILSNKNSFSFSSLSQKLILKNSYIFLLGILLGITFQIRYQTAFFMVGFYFWTIFNVQQKIKFTLFLALGFLLTIGLALHIDRWGYGIFTFTPLNYYIENIVHGVAASFGVEPWYTYIPFINDSIYPQFGILLFLLYFSAVIKYRKNLFIWCSLVFFVAHSLVGHKESRFLFPILISMMIPSCELFVDILLQKKWGKIFLHPITRCIIYILIFLNFVEIARNTLRIPTKNMNSLEFLQKRLKNDSYYGFHSDIQCDNNNESIGNYCGLKLSFYTLNHKEFFHLNSLAEFEEDLKKINKPEYLYIGGRGINFLNNVFYTQNCKIAYNSSIMPNWVFTEKHKWLSFLLKRTESSLFLRCH